jgi:hypothetical protein
MEHVKLKVVCFTCYFLTQIVGARQTYLFSVIKDKCHKTKVIQVCWHVIVASLVTVYKIRNRNDFVQHRYTKRIPY